MNNLIKIGLAGALTIGIGVEIIKAGCVNMIRAFNGINEVAERVCAEAGYEIDLVDVDEEVVEVFE